MEYWKHNCELTQARYHVVVTYIVSILNSKVDCTIAQAVSCWPLTAEVCVGYQVRPRTTGFVVGKEALGQASDEYVVYLLLLSFCQFLILNHA
jgi:hypothetical protein